MTSEKIEPPRAKTFGLARFAELAGELQLSQPRRVEHAVVRIQPKRQLAARYKNHRA